MTRAAGKVDVSTRLPWSGRHRAGLVLVVTIAALCACDVRRDPTKEPIEECVSYAEHLRSCVSSRAADAARASFAVPPRDEAARTALKNRCSQQRERLRAICR